MWSCLRRINVSLTVKGYGRLFEIPEIADPCSILSLDDRIEEFNAL